MTVPLEAGNNKCYIKGCHETGKTECVKILKTCFAQGIYLQHGKFSKLKDVPVLWWDTAAIFWGVEANFGLAEGDNTVME